MAGQDTSQETPHRGELAFLFLGMLLCMQPFGLGQRSRGCFYAGCPTYNCISPEKNGNIGDRKMNM
jgi:hypothetical protein